MFFPISGLTGIGQKFCAHVDVQKKVSVKIKSAYLKKVREKMEGKTDATSLKEFEIESINGQSLTQNKKSVAPRFTTKFMNEMEFKSPKSIVIDITNLNNADLYFVSYNNKSKKFGYLVGTEIKHNLVLADLTDTDRKIGNMKKITITKIDDKEIGELARENYGFDIMSMGKSTDGKNMYYTYDIPIKITKAYTCNSIIECLAQLAQKFVWHIFK